MKDNRIVGALLAAGLALLLGVVEVAGAAFSRTTTNGGSSLTMSPNFFAGGLYGWGDNTTGQLGLGNNTSPRTSPQLVSAQTTWSYVETSNQPAIDAQTGHTCAIKTDATLWCWGRNYHGQLGRGNYSDSYSPVQIAGSWKKIALGGMHTCGIKTTGTLWCWGQNSFGQLGVGSNTTWDDPRQVGTYSNWTEVAAGNVQTCGIRGGAVYCWGEGLNYKLGNGSTAEQTVPDLTSSNTTHTQITVGRMHACALRSGGALYCWGLNDSGQLGRGSYTIAQTPTLISGTWTAIAAGRDHTCGLQGGELYCWGLNGFYELGLGHTSDRTSPTRIGSATDWARITPSNESTCGNRTDRTIYCWGRNIDGQLGQGDTSTETVPKLVSGRTGTVYAGGTGSSTTFAIG
ncbi:MAG TPA: hypothetical protein VFY17_09535 [Pilimelia sp.]|nr:hypothetical protein [Pilimelia sp.]